MTATAELVRMARDIVPPRSASTLRCIVEVEASDRLSNGTIAGVVIGADGSKRAPRTRYGVAWLIDGRAESRPIAMFDLQRDAHALYRILAGEEVAPRGATLPELPVRLCAGCDQPLPAGSRPNRTTHDGACRIAAARRRAASDQPSSGTSPDAADVTVSRANLGDEPPASRSRPDPATETAARGGSVQASFEASVVTLAPIQSAPPSHGPALEPDGLGRGAARHLPETAAPL